MISVANQNQNLEGSDGSVVGTVARDGRAPLALELLRLRPLLVTATGPFGPAIPLLLVRGMAWIATLTTLNAAVQLTLPPWVRARGMAIYLLVFSGSQALGSYLWGLIAAHFGLAQSLLGSRPPSGDSGRRGRAFAAARNRNPRPDNVNRLAHADTGRNSTANTARGWLASDHNALASAPQDTVDGRAEEHWYFSLAGPAGVVGGPLRTGESARVKRSTVLLSGILPSPWADGRV